MKGVGGPLLCIGDLLSDLEEPLPQEDHIRPIKQSSSLPSSPLATSTNHDFQSHDLTKLFQDNYSKLNEALSGSDHSWTTLTLKLCNAMETANKLVESTNSNVRVLNEKVEELERVVKRGDAVVANAKAVHLSLNRKGGTSFGRH